VEEEVGLRLPPVVQEGTEGAGSKDDRSGSTTPRLLPLVSRDVIEVSEYTLGQEHQLRPRASDQPTFHTALRRQTRNLRASVDREGSVHNEYTILQHQHTELMMGHVERNDAEKIFRHGVDSGFKSVQGLATRADDALAQAEERMSQSTSSRASPCPSFDNDQHGTARERLASVAPSEPYEDAQELFEDSVSPFGSARDQIQEIWQTGEEALEGQLENRGDGAEVDIDAELNRPDNEESPE
jgi:hypothetical protein